jgi:hypothetical protein
MPNDVSYAIRLEPAPVVSFVIPVRNDAARLSRCLSTILANEYARDRVEIVVVDNGSVDASVDVARVAGATVLQLPGRPVSELRNLGAAAATGDVLAFVDADHEIAADWIAHAVEDLTSAASVGAVGTLCEPPANGTWVQQTYDLLRRRGAGTHDVEWLGSGNMAVSRRAFEEVGGFDTSLQTCEDVDLCRRFRMRGYRILQDPRLRNVHLGDPSTLTALFRGELWRGGDNLRASLRGPLSLRELPSVILPVADLGFLALSAVALISGLRFGVTVAVLALAGILSSALARALRMIVRADRVTPLGCAQAVAVAVTYDVARALALVRPGGHDARKARG